MDALGDLLVAPIEPWDALICTSQAVKEVVDHVLNSWREYLGERFHADVSVRIQLPIIPLGVDCDSFERSEANSAQRTEIRRQLGIEPDDIAVLFVGRMSYHTKAHPLPMYTALEEVARRTHKRLHMMHFGWFANDELKKQFVAAAQSICPSVNCHFLGDRHDWKQGVWQAADIFMSLSDNIQETFGLTPVEAMAASLPQVISDWNGYRDTVRNGVDGFRIPTVMPPPGAGDDLMVRYSLGLDGYDNFIGAASQSIAVDIGSCISALERLVNNQNLRADMGEAGRKRAREIFDWRVIIKAYQALWRELAARRTAAAATSSSVPMPHPLREDPFDVFSHYATCTLDASCVLDIGENFALDRLQKIVPMRMNHFAASSMCPQQEIVALMHIIASEAPVLLGEVLERIPLERHTTVYRTLGWLAKMDAIRILGLNSIGLD